MDKFELVIDQHRRTSLSPSVQDDAEKQQPRADPEKQALDTAHSEQCPPAPPLTAQPIHDRPITGNNESQNHSESLGDAHPQSSCDDDAGEPVKDRGWEAWKFVLASAATEFMVWGASYGYGSFQEYHQHDPSSPFHRTSLTATSSIGTSLLAGQHFITLFTFGIYSMFPSLIKLFTYICVLGAALSLLIASFADSVALLIVFQGLLLGMFGGNIFTTVILWLPDWWDQRRGFATALIFAGSGIGGILWPIIFTQLLEHVGFRWTLRTWALIQLVVSGGATLCLKPGRKPQAVAGRFRWRSVLPGFPRSLLSAVTLLNIAVLLLQTTAYYSVALNISNYASSMGYSSTTSTGILSAFNASAAVTYFVLGYLVDRFPYALLMATSTALNLVFTVLVFGFAGRSLTKIVIFVVFYGVTGGGFSSFLTPVSRDIRDKSRSHEFSLRFLYLVCVRGIAAMLGPIVAVQFYPERLGAESTYGSFGFTRFIAFIAGTLALSTLASLAIFAHKRYVEPRRQRVKALSSPRTPPPEPRVDSVYAT
ncbi:related to monocarboxylate permease [Sporisorium reilianum f. sp. reilianum]|uniref:Related to monocarboxylate permease n=1 Tax=Sporisorium reilianum f. sp. reilianum TaxID=72559 RepID=A0A2N8UCE7_9BASI|nr:related to monocarboxylate permease [Sporisorium reilianum f. sp. reilianum]